ncbi:hypothetical protein R1flu_016709 [Riccia fluitans]|uniref:Uncharacterized protein n=1 Tax=Riccia fluitans TaxID=41844 RepID=A0ABD1YMV3_9MARC
MANEALERELVILKHQAEESQKEVQKLPLRLDTTLLDLATKNQIITQVHEEILGLRATVRALESEKLARQEVLNHYLELCDSLVRYHSHSMFPTLQLL